MIPPHDARASRARADERQASPAQTDERQASQARADERRASNGRAAEGRAGEGRAGGGSAGNRVVHPIEAESYRIIRRTVDTGHLPRYSRDVTERIIHTTADPAWCGDLVLDEGALAAGAAALAAGAPLVVDVTMVAAGVTSYPSHCLLKAPEAAELAATAGLTRSAAAVRLAARLAGDGAVWAVGNAPTALYELIALARASTVRPALVIGLPVGYVGAAESKAALRQTDLPQLSNVSARGGSAVASAAVNALLYGDPLPPADSPLNGDQLP